MKKRLLALITGAALVGTLLAGCGSTSENTESPGAAGNTGSASGGGWPSGPVSIVVPASAGGASRSRSWCRRYRRRLPGSGAGR